MGGWDLAGKLNNTRVVDVVKGTSFDVTRGPRVFKADDDDRDCGRDDRGFDCDTWTMILSVSVVCEPQGCYTIKTLLIDPFPAVIRK